MSATSRNAHGQKQGGKPRNRAAGAEARQAEVLGIGHVPLVGQAFRAYLAKACSLQTNRPRGGQYPQLAGDGTENDDRACRIAVHSLGPTQRKVGAALGERSRPIIDVIAPSILLLGFIRGTVLGPIDSVGEVFTSAYGITWLLAIVMIVAIFVWSRFVILAAVDRLATAPLTPDGGPTPELEAALARAKVVTVLELAGFFVIFTLTILMRFGL